MSQQCRWGGVACAILATMIGGGAVASADAGAVPGEAAGADRAIAVQLARIAEAVEALERGQQVEVLIARLRLRHERLRALEGRVGTSGEAIRSLEDELEQFRMFEEQLGGDGLEQLSEEEAEEVRRQRALVAERMKAVENQVADLRLRHVDLENDLANAEREVEDLERAIDERLGLR